MRDGRGGMVHRGMNLAGAACLLTCISLSAAQWEPEVRLTFESHRSLTCYNNARCVAAGGIGNMHDVHVVWHDWRSSYPEVYYKRSSNQGSDWGPDTLISAPGAGDGRDYPTVCVSYPYVHVAAHYIGVDNGAGIKHIRSADAGHTWMQEMTLDYYPPYPIPDLGTPSIAASDSNVHVVYDVFLSSSGWTNGMIYYIRSVDNGATWGDETQLYITGVSPFPASPSLGVSGGSVHVVWQQAGAIRHIRSGDGGTTWGNIGQLDETPDESVGPSITVDGNHVHVVWCDDRNGGPDIYYKRSDDDGTTWSQDMRLTDSQDAQEMGSVHADGDIVHVVWVDDRHGDNEIYYRRSVDHGVSWEPEYRITDAPDSSCNASVTAYGDHVHVAWCDRRDGNWEVYYRCNPSGNQAVMEETVRSLPVRAYALLPNPAVDHAVIAGHEHEEFVLYDVAGREVGRHQGSRIGGGLAPGVYFVGAAGMHGRFVRFIKAR